MIEDIKKTLWATADKLRANMDAAEYEHIVLGLIFVKYISDTFQTRRAELTRKFLDARDDYFLDGAHNLQSSDCECLQSLKNHLNTLKIVALLKYKSYTDAR
jgi:type I restriction-modification system DNA methylase subunit